MDRRLELQAMLQAIIGIRLDKESNVYFQPPATLNLVYPCIVYRRNNIDTRFADNIPYAINKQYQITVIDPNPDSLIPDKIGKLPKCVFDRYFTANNLNHDVYTIYY